MWWCEHFWGYCRRDPSVRPSKNASNLKHLHFSATISHSLHFQQQLFRVPGLPHIFPVLYLEPSEFHPTKDCTGFLEDSLGLGSCRSNNNSNIHRIWAMCQAWKCVLLTYFQLFQWSYYNLVRQVLLLSHFEDGSIEA